jgi:hypothetical protein
LEMVATPKPAPSKPSTVTAVPPKKTEPEVAEPLPEPAAEEEEITVTPVFSEPPPFVVDPAATPARDAREIAARITEKEIADRAKYRALRQKMLQDPEVIQARDAADAATGDTEKKEAYKRYYFLLYDKMRTADPSLREWINRMEAAHLRRLEQKRTLDTAEKE